VRARAASHDEIALADRFDVAADAAAGARTADACTDRRTLCRNRAGDAEAAGAAATADALREQAVRIGAMSDDRAGAAHGNEIAVAAGVAGAAEAELRALALGNAGCDAEAAVATAAADALRQDAVRAIALCREHAVDRSHVAEQDFAGVAPTIAITADAGVERAAIAGDRAGNAEATRTAATADALREYRVRFLTSRRDPAAAVERDVVAVATTAAA